MDDDKDNEIKTFVIFDLETVGYNYNNNNSNSQDLPRIFQLAMIAISKENLLHVHENCLYRDGQSQCLDGYVQKLTQLYDPKQNLSRRHEESVGINNDNLNHLPPFRATDVKAINAFLGKLESPVCLVAHNGIKFDYPILKAEMREVESDSIKGLLCADSLIFARQFENDDIKHMQELAKNFEELDFEDSDRQSTLENDNSVSVDVSENFESLDGGPSIPEDLAIPNSDLIENMYKSPKKMPLNSHNVPHRPSKPGTDLRVQNDYTPDRKLHPDGVDNSNYCHTKVRRALTYRNEDSTVKEIQQPFSLSNLHRRIFGHDHQAHKAESDAMALLKICAFHGRDFISWADQNCTQF